MDCHLLQDAIDELLESTHPKTLQKAFCTLSELYRCRRIKSSLKSIFQDEAMRLAYLATRMPATYSAALQVLKCLPCSPSSWIDLGAGPGTASWAAANLFPSASRFTLIEKSSDAIRLGKEIAKHHPLLKKAHWIHDTLPTKLPLADIAILSYSLGELDRPLSLINDWWVSNIETLAIIEPGTPQGFSLIREVRNQILAKGGILIAPCPHSLACPIQKDDWCHFSVRIPRTKLHRYLKHGSLGYEDEKYSYLIATRSLPAELCSYRILRHPKKQKGFVHFPACIANGTLQEITITRSHPEAYRKARDSRWGDCS